jgi:PAS domain S-box-containing protein
LALSPEDITPPEAKEIMRCSIAQLEEGRSTADHEGITLKKDGSKVNVLVGNRLLQWHGQRVYYTTFKDITKRKRAEIALAESEKSFRSMFEASSDALNLVCIEDGRFLEVNNSMCLMFGYSREELLTMSPRDLINAENIPEQNDVLSAVLERGSAISDKGTVVRKKDGSMVQALVAAQIIAWKGKRVIYSSLRDITPLKRIQGQLEQKNKETLEFTDTVTHDLKKPLTTMNIVLGLAKKNAFGILNPDGVDAIDTGIEASHYMQEMLDDLLACARLESGTQKLVIEETRLGEMVEAVLTRMKYQIEEKKIQIVPPDNDISVMADRKQLTRVLMNLIGNAINYIGSGTDKFIRIAWEQKNGAPVFMVADNGIGVPEASRKDLFAKFKRGSNVSGVQGTGLGLSIVKGIVEAHGGKIWFESEVDKGTTFYFTLIGKEMKS